MNKTICKRILGLFIFIFVFITIFSLNIKNVYAVDSEKCEETRKTLNSNTLASRYGINMECDNINTCDNYILTMNLGSSAPNIDKGKVKFKISQIRFYTPDFQEQNGTTVEIMKFSGTTYNNSAQIDTFRNNGVIDATTIKNGGKISIKRSGFDFGSNTGFAVTLVPDGFDDPSLAASCGANTSFDITVGVNVFVGKSFNSVIDVQYGSIDTSGFSKKLDCSNPTQYPENSFERNFCNDKKTAEANLGKTSGVTQNSRKYVIKDHSIGNMIRYDSNNKKVDSNEAISFKCDYNNLVTGVPKNDSEYYVNKKYLIGEGYFEEADQYTYHTECSREKGWEKETVKCEIKCEEVVTVEYGPPIASKAGLCFEYKVKVTSRVNCEMDKEPKKPKGISVCIPKPVCITRHKDGTTSISKQGGPNEEFDKCIKSCDGGKYTDKCSQKCYKKIYGNSISKTSSGKEISYANKMANDTATLNMYTCDGKGTIGWGSVVYTPGKVNLEINTLDRDRKSAAQEAGVSTWRGGFIPGFDPTYYMLDTSWGYKHEYNCSNSDGMPASCTCVDDCHWEVDSSGICGDSNYAHYLNADEVYRYGGMDPIFNQDAAENQKVYENLKKRCEAYASCSTTTAEFTISVDYTTNGSNEVKTIKFPYSSNKDTIKYNNVDSVSCTKDNRDSTILSSNGCYNCGKANTNNTYQTEWSFPGTWIHNKTGEITYDKSKVNSKTWQEQTNKFCLPLNIKNVNEKWYNYYYAKVHGNDNKFSYNDTDHTNNIICPDGTSLESIACDYKNSTFDNSDEAKLKYNIKALAKKFGFFEWNIDIKCFYAVNSEFPSTPEKDCTQKCIQKRDPMCGVGDCKADSGYRVRTVDLTNLFPDNEGNKLPTTDVTGRTPGFNWTKYSNQTIKDPAYQSLPSNYTKWIQAKGYSVYSDDYLDYEVILDKDMINKLKRVDKNYTDWQGDVVTGSVNNYQSPLFRNDGILSSVSKYPNGKALKCNNMKNYKSSECEDFSGEVK